MNGHLYYELLSDGTIGRSTNDAEIAKEIGLTLETDREIVYGYDCKRYFKGEEPTPPPRKKCYSVPDLFWWVRLYDESHGTDKGNALKALLDAKNLYTIAVTTRVVSEDNPAFAHALVAICETVGFTDEECDEALEYAETDASPESDYAKGE